MPAPAKDQSKPATSGAIGVAEASFLDAFEPVLVDDPTPFTFDGSLSRKHMRTVWNWLIRDIAPDLKTEIELAVTTDTSVEAAIDAALPDALARIRKDIADAANSGESDRRLRSQLGGDEVRERLPVVVNAFRCRTLLAKATSFGRASNSMQDEAALGTAINSMPLKDPGIAALLMHAMVGQAANPSRLVSAVTLGAGGASEAAMRRAGMGPLIEALLAHAQNQLSRLSGQQGVFADADLICRAVSRFHKLVRAVTGYIELERGSRWSLITAEVTKHMAQAIEPRLREVSSDVSQSLRKPREGADRVDADRLLAALNGIYLLATVREARDSLALNALFDTIWSETGQNLEVLLTRNLENYKQNPGDENTAKRLETGIKMAEIRFNPEYAEILRRAKEGVERRLQSTG